MSCGGGHRYGSGLMLPWLWCRLSAVAPIWSLAWEPPYAAGAVLKGKKNKKERKKKENVSFRAYIKRLENWIHMYLDCFILLHKFIKMLQILTTTLNYNKALETWADTS